MRQVSVDECPAGPWLDAAVAKALGYEVKGAFLDGVFFPAGCVKDGEWVSFNRDLGGWWPSTDLAAAWELVEESDLFVDNFLTKNEDGKYIVCPIYAGFGEYPEYYEGADENVALAITRAFLKARGIARIEVPDGELSFDEGKA